jgi:hypothetical protein
MSSNIDYNKLQDGNNYENTNKFLFVFTPGFTAHESCCGCSVKTGAQIISIFYIISSLTNFFSSFNSYSDWSVFLSGMIFLIYFTAGVCIFLSSMNQNYRHCYNAYLIYGILFIINFLDSVVISLLIFTRLYNPIQGFSHLKSGFYYMITSVFVLSLQLYFVWIIYSYAIELKEKSKSVPINTLEEPFRKREEEQI